MTTNKLSKKALYWQGVINEFSQSSLSVAEFCSSKSVSLQSFYQWRRKLEVSEQRNLPQHALVPITLLQNTSQPRPSLIHITTASGISLRIDSQTPPEDIAKLVALIDAASRGDR